MSTATDPAVTHLVHTKRYAELKKKAINSVGGPTAWTNFTMRIHQALIADQILTWQMAQDESIPAEHLREVVGDLWGLMMGDEEL